jgi:hypothetical protein
VKPLLNPKLQTESNRIIQVSDPNYETSQERESSKGMSSLLLGDSESEYGDE